jgi:hypothetical protein
VSLTLLSRAPSDLRALAAAIKMGRLSSPFSVVAVKQIVNDAPYAVTQSLTEMSDTGMSAVGIAYTLELLAATMADRPRIEDLVQVVATGPQVNGVANRDTSVVVSDLFSQAEKSVMVVGYAVYQGQKVFQSLAARMTERPDLNGKMYLDITRKPGDTSKESELVKRFCHHFHTTQWPAGHDSLRFIMIRDRWQLIARTRLLYMRSALSWTEITYSFHRLTSPKGPRQRISNSD